MRIVTLFTYFFNIFSHINKEIFIVNSLLTIYHNNNFSLPRQTLPTKVIVAPPRPMVKHIRVQIGQKN
jgi:hypothetical protein